MGKKVLMDMEIVQSTMHEDDLAKSLYCSLTLKGEILTYSQISASGFYKRSDPTLGTHHGTHPLRESLEHRFESTSI